MKRVSGLVTLSCALLFLACEKNPAGPKLGDQYQLPDTPDGATLDGGELLFWPVDTREGLEETKGVFAVSADGSAIHRLNWVSGESFASPTLLADGRVAAIQQHNYTTSTPADIVIFDWGEPTPLHIDLEYGPSFIQDVVGLKGPSADKLMYDCQDGLRVLDLTTGQVTRPIPSYLESRPAALPDGRIAVVIASGGSPANGYILIVRTDGTVDAQVPLPTDLVAPPSSQEADAPVVFGLSDGRLLLAHRASDSEVQFYVAEADSQPVWSRVTGFPSLFPPKPPEFRAWGVQLLSQDRLAYVHEDHFNESAPYFNMVVGRIVGSTITGAAPIFRSRIDTRDLGNGRSGLYYLEWVIYR